MRVLENGDIIFPQRGWPPRTPEGYDVDPQDPYLFHPVWEDCVHRYQRAFTCSNGRTKHRPSCRLIGSDVQFPTCDACTRDKTK